MNLKTFLLAALAAFTLASCDKDENNNVKPKSETTFKNVGMSLQEGAYGSWTYVNLATGEHEAHPDFGTWTYVNPQTKEVKREQKPGSLADVKIKWDIAFRYNLVRTNEGATKMLTATEFAQVKPEDLNDVSVKDTIATGKDRVLVDFAQMMHGVVSSTSNDVRNPVLSSVFTRKGQMPNITYEAKPNVVALRTKDGRHFLLKFKSFSNNADIKGFYTFDVLKVK